MTRIWLYIISAILLFGGVVWAISHYIVIDDMADCGDYPTLDAACAPADAIVAVSGGDTAARTAEAVKLYLAGWAPTLILSGAAADTSGPSNAEVMASQAIEAGVDPSDIVIEPNSRSTLENAAETGDIFREHDVESAILVTSAYHSRRAVLEFRAKSGDMVEVRSHPVMSDAQWDQFWWLRVTGWWLAIGETIKSLIVQIGGAV